MKYKNNLSKIVEVLRCHKTEIDNLVLVYKTEKANFEKEVAGMKGTYTHEYISEYSRNWQPKGNYADAIKKLSDKTVIEVTHYAERIKKELDKYFDSMVRTDFVNRINAISLTGLPLRDKEFELLAESASNYMELRMISHLAESRTQLKTIAKVNEHGETENEEVEVKIPCKIELPDIDRVYGDYNSFVTSAKSFAKYYVGEGAELKGYLGEGVSEYAPLTAISFFRNNAADRFAETMEKANSVLPESKVKREITEADRKFIDVIIDPAYPALAESKVKEIVKAGEDSELVELLRIDPRYSEIVEKLEVCE